MDGVKNGYGARGFAKGRLQLKDTARIAGGHEVGVESADVICFASAEFKGGIRFDKIVDAGGAAADRGLGNFKEFEARDVGEELARLGAHALSVLQMAGVVEGHAGVQGLASSAGPELRKDFGDVPALQRETAGAFRVGRIVAKQSGGGTPGAVETVTKPAP